MKTTIAIIILFFINIWSAFPQNTAAIPPNEDLKSYKRLDSIVEYQYLSEFDSIPLYMREYIYDDFGSRIVEASYRWDTILNRWFGYGYVNWDDFWFGEGSKVEWTYDQSGNITSTVGYFWDTIANVWVNSSKHEYGYDQAGNKTMSAFFQWNIEEQKWDGSNICLMGCHQGKYEWEYDSLGQCITEASYYWEDNEWGFGIKYDYIRNIEGKVVLRVESGMINGKWEKGSLYRWHYDKNGNLEVFVNYSWNFDSNDWIGNHKTEMTYDEKDQITSELDYKWDPKIDDWVVRSNIHYLWEYTYNENGDCTLSIEYTKRPPATEWGPNKKREYEFDFAGNKTQEIYYNWENGWVANHKYENRYDSFNNNIFHASYSWDMDSADWRGLDRTERSFDPEGRITSEAVYDWNWRKGDWEGNSKYEWEYDDKSNVVRFIMYGGFTSWLQWHKYEYMFDNDSDLIISSLYYSYRNELTNRTFYYYQSSSTGIEEFSRDEISLFPNPSSGIINITGINQPADIKVYSIQGQLLKTENLVLNSIDLSDLPDGMYFLKIFANDKPVSTARVVKR